MGKIIEHKWQILAATLIVIGFGLSRGSASTALMPLLRFVIPVVVVYFLIRLISKKLSGAATGAFRSRIEQAMKTMQEQQERARSQAGGGSKPVIDLCPKCGSYLKAGHRC